GERGGQGPALDELHGQERAAVGEGADLVDGRDARVLELAGDGGFVVEPADGRRGLAEGGANELDRDLPIEAWVGGPVNDPHAALVNLAHDRVSADGRRDRLDSTGGTRGAER